MPVDEVKVLTALKAQYEAEQAREEPTGVISAELIHDLLLALRGLRDRVVVLEGLANRAAVVDTLPANAALGLLFRRRGDTSGALYLGNGPSQPLTKLAPSAL